MHDSKIAFFSRFDDGWLQYFSMKNSESKRSELTSFWRRCVRFHVWIEREPNKSFAALCDCKVHVFFFCRLIGLKLAMVSTPRCQIADWVRSIYIQLHWSLYGELKGIVFSASSPAKIIAFDLKVIFMIINARPSNFSGFFQFEKSHEHIPIIEPIFSGQRPNSTQLHPNPSELCPQQLKFAHRFHAMSKFNVNPSES